MQRSGCWGNVVGFESITADSLRDARKSPNIAGFARFASEIDVLRSHGMQTWAAFTLGYDHDTVASIEATVDFALESKFTFAAYNILMPYPGTALYSIACEAEPPALRGQMVAAPRVPFQSGRLSARRP